MKMKNENQFAVALLTFAEVKAIKDACAEYGKKGSSAAKKISEELEKQMNELEV